MRSGLRPFELFKAEPLAPYFCSPLIAHHSLLVEPALQNNRGGGAVNYSLVLLLFLFAHIRGKFLRLHARIRLVLRMDFHSREAKRQILDKRLHHHVLSVFTAIRMVRHPDHELVNFVDFHQLIQAFEQIGRFLVNRLARKCHFKLGIAKSDPNSMFTVIQSKVIHVTKYRIRTLNIAFFRSFFYLCARN